MNADKKINSVSAESDRKLNEYITTLKRTEEK